MTGMASQHGIVEVIAFDRVNHRRHEFHPDEDDVWR
ncbi:unnamed protein product [Haemonchus placei]|uniref:Uncharacterized protein n=1 Tax=Haemonchus placei TaxID=6290 RepID=A0A3P7V2C2_HAEPC|nr:unnamed protein product [Haemonchus placei]